jgi:hypothetical protein
MKENISWKNWWMSTKKEMSRTRKQKDKYLS